MNMKTTTGDTALTMSVIIEHVLCGFVDESYIADDHNHYKCAKMLLEAGADVNIANNDCRHCIGACF